MCLCDFKGHVSANFSRKFKISAEFLISIDVKKKINVIFYLIQGQDLKVIKCIGRAEFENEFLYSDQCVHRLLFGFVRSCLFFNFLVNVLVEVEKFLQRLMCTSPPPDSRRNIVIMNLLFLSQN